MDVFRRDCGTAGSSRAIAIRIIMPVSVVRLLILSETNLQFVTGEATTLSDLNSVTQFNAN